jgi:cobalamin biosynthesis protein CobD/CbiB
LGELDSRTIDGGVGLDHLFAARIWLGAVDSGYFARTAHRSRARMPVYPEAAVAGALGVQLGGLNYYRGVASHKAHLGDAESPLSFPRLRVLLYGVAALATAGACLR